MMTQASPFPPKLDAPRVLVVDDEPTLRLGFSVALETDGFEVEMAMDGAEALKRLHDAGQPEIDAMVLDLRMPEIDGMQVVKALQRDKALVPTIIASAYLDAVTAVEAINLGITDFVRKPATPEGLRSAVHGILKEEEKFEDGVDGNLETLTEEEMVSYARWCLRRGRLDEAIDSLEKSGRVKTDRLAGVWHMLANHLRLLREEGQSPEEVSPRFYRATDLLDLLSA